MNRRVQMPGQDAGPRAKLLALALADGYRVREETCILNNTRRQCQLKATVKVNVLALIPTPESRGLLFGRPFFVM
jgi:hypothetical protein